MARPKLSTLLLVFAAAALPLEAMAQTTYVLKSMKFTLPDSNEVLPPGNGADVANANCLVCHSAGMVMNQPALPRAAWEAEVNKMRNVYKAHVDDSNVGAITDYLTSIKGPKQ